MTEKTLPQQQIIEQTGETDLQRSVEAVCAALEDRGSKALADAVRAALGQEAPDNIVQRQVFEFDVSPDGVNREKFLASKERLLNVSNRFNDIYHCQEEFNHWLKSSLMNPETRLGWLNGMKISNALIGNINLGGSAILVASSIMANIRMIETDLVKLVVSFYTENDLENATLADDIRIVQKYCAQQGWWK